MYVLPVPYLVPILFSLIIIVGSIGNILVVLVVILNKTMRNNTNILILNLAVSIYKENHFLLDKSFAQNNYQNVTIRLVCKISIKIFSCHDINKIWNIDE